MALQTLHLCLGSMISPVPLQSLHGTWTCGTGGAGGERRQRLLGRTQRAQSRARGGTDLLHHGAELAEHDLGALAVTARALLDGALLAALAVAALADDVLLERELRHLALVEVGKRNVDAVDEVLALARTLGTPASSAAEAEGLNAQNGDDDQARSARRSKGWSSRQEREGTYASSAASAAEQLREQVLGVHAAAHAAHAALEAGLTSLVVDRPLLRVREDLVAEGEGSRAQAKMERKRRDVWSARDPARRRARRPSSASAPRQRILDEASAAGVPSAPSVALPKYHRADRRRRAEDESYARVGDLLESLGVAALVGVQPERPASARKRGSALVSRQQRALGAEEQSKGRTSCGKPS